MTSRRRYNSGSSGVSSSVCQSVEHRLREIFTSRSRRAQAYRKPVTSKALSAFRNRLRSQVRDIMGTIDGLLRHRLFLRRWPQAGTVRGRRTKCRWPATPALKRRAPIVATARTGRFLSRPGTKKTAWVFNHLHIRSRISQTSGLRLCEGHMRFVVRSFRLGRSHVISLGNSSTSAATSAS